MTDRPFASLPPTIELDLDDVALLLEALARAPDGDASVRAAKASIYRKLWPELGDLYGEEGQ
ncbi:MAG TPA: hypothetical protein VF640_07615 [Acidimicrobiales bacterium]|jgi:hypothetical protein